MRPGCAADLASSLRAGAQARMKWWPEAMGDWFAAHKKDPAYPSPPSWWSSYVNGAKMKWDDYKAKAVYDGRFTALFKEKKREERKYVHIFGPRNKFTMWRPAEVKGRNLCAGTGCPNADNGGCAAVMCPSVADHMLRELYYGEIADPRLSLFLDVARTETNPVQQQERKEILVKFLRNDCLLPRADWRKGQSQQKLDACFEIWVRA